MAEKAFCVHGHFYQPSREDPWTGEIPVEIGATPYRNWNEKIFNDCYLPNIQEGNFSKISFNIGPTLTRWMRQYQPEAIQKIVEADKDNFNKFGCGNAMAQPYHHTILPLASRKDKRIQMIWGIKDFEMTFGRKPEGMWFPEAAVNQETLDTASDLGIRYTILAPWQVKNEEKQNPSWVRTANGKSMTIFLYNRSLSSDVSFNSNATINADTFAQSRLQREYSSGNPERLLLIATDGELYGHHQPFREKFLSRLMNGELSRLDIDTSFPALWLRDHDSIEENEVCENTSWSCMHGVKRWAGECGCSPHGVWKYWLRNAIDKVAELVDQVYVEYASSRLMDPWQAVEQYAEVFLGLQSFPEWLTNQSKTTLSMLEKTNLKSLFDAQYERQRMYTSCGWFFDDFDRIEPTNNVAYAAHAIWLTERAADVDLYSNALERFRQVISWKSGLKGDDVFASSYYRFSGRS